jgi:SPX domain protein involved in polyphosphate accumulation
LCTSEVRIADVNSHHTDNIDYNELKHLIKVHTSKTQGNSIAIPGQEDTRLQQFEERFYQELFEQHDRVDLFVRVKAEEIIRRLREYR